MRRVTPFSWTRLFVFPQNFDRVEIQHDISRELGFQWKDAPAHASPSVSQNLLVFASKHRVVSALLDGNIWFRCLSRERGWTPGRSRFLLLRVGPKSSTRRTSTGLPRVIAVSTPVARSSDSENGCDNVWGILH
jgi:hypothetical protein